MYMQKQIKGVALPELKKVGMLLLGHDGADIDRIIQLFQENGYPLCIEESNVDGMVLGIMMRS